MPGWRWRQWNVKTSMMASDSVPMAMRIRTPVTVIPSTPARSIARHPARCKAASRMDVPCTEASRASRRPAAAVSTAWARRNVATRSGGSSWAPTHVSLPIAGGTMASLIRSIRSNLCQAEASRRSWAARHASPKPNRESPCGPQSTDVTDAKVCTQLLQLASSGPVDDAMLTCASWSRISRGSGGRLSIKYARTRSSVCQGCWAYRMFAQPVPVNLRAGFMLNGEVVAVRVKQTFGVEHVLRCRWVAWAFPSHLHSHTYRASRAAVSSASAWTKACGRFPASGAGWRRTPRCTIGPARRRHGCARTRHVPRSPSALMLAERDKEAAEQECGLGERTVVMAEPVSVAIDC